MHLHSRNSRCAILHSTFDRSRKRSELPRVRDGVWIPSCTRMHIINLGNENKNEICENPKLTESTEADLHDGVTPKTERNKAEREERGALAKSPTRATCACACACACACRRATRIRALESVPGELTRGGPRLRELSILQSSAITETMQSVQGIGTRGTEPMCVSLRDLARAYLHRASNPRDGTGTGVEISRRARERSLQLATRAPRRSCAKLRKSLIAGGTKSQLLEVSYLRTDFLPPQSRQSPKTRRSLKCAISF